MTTRRMTSEELQQEAEGWDSRKVDPHDWEDAPEAVPRAAQSVQISLRLPKKLLDILRELARREGIGYQVLMKRWLDERVRREHEKMLARSREVVLERPTVVRRAASYVPGRSVRFDHGKNES